MLLYKYCINLWYVKLTRTFYLFILELRLLKIYVLKIYIIFMLFIYLFIMCYFNTKK